MGAEFNNPLQISCMFDSELVRPKECQSESKKYICVLYIYVTKYIIAGYVLPYIGLQ